VQEPFDRDGWIFEIKWDGFRAISDVRETRVRIVSRNQKNLAPYFPSIVEELKTLPFSAVLDSELVILDGEGKADFEKLLR
jgi:bifunctional non-homologous end joining protein LigD